MTGTVHKVDRFQFLRGNFSGGNRIVRPPWAIPENIFSDACERCEKCTQACPEQIIGRGSGGYPEVSFANGDCTFCEACVEACPTHALSLVEPLALETRRAPWRIHAEITDGCIARAGVECRVCGEYCEAGAIRFRLAVGGAATPEIDRDLCSGCGACVAPCPVDAVAVN